MVDNERIRKQAKNIMDEFISALDRVGDIKNEYGLERDEQTRIPKTPDIHVDGFRERVFKNAPRKNSDYIITDKKHW